MKNLVKLLDNKRSLLSLGLLTVLIFTTYKIQENSSAIKKLSNFESGIQTCFGRVNQTYMANLLGDKVSSYLTSNFQNLTEECLAEGLLTAESLNSEKAILASRQLSNLASNVHWFHEDILAPESSKANTPKGETRDVSTRFEKIETMKDELLDLVNNEKNEISSTLSQQKSIFYVSATLLFVVMLIEYLSLTSRKISNNMRENEAIAELQSGGGATSVKLAEILKTALEQNDLMNCSKLFSNFYTYALSEKNQNKSSLESLVTPVRAKANSEASREINNVINKIWEDDSIGVNVDKTTNEVNVKIDNVNLELMSSSVIDLHAEKLFACGIQVDLKIPEGLMIQGREEDLEQSLYHLISHAISSTKTENKEKTISIFAHKLGDVVAFDLLYSGAGFHDSILKQRVGLEAGLVDRDLDLKIAQTLLSELQAKVQFDNKLDQNGNAIGGRVKIIFKTGDMTKAQANTQNGRLVDLKVGTRKEILATLQSQPTHQSQI